MIWDEAKVATLRRRLREFPKPTYVELGREFGCARGAIAGAVDRYVYGNATPKQMEPSE